MVVRLAIDLRLFDLLAEKSPQTVKELGEATGAEEGLIVRLLRTLVGMGFAKQQDKTHFAANAVTKQMSMASVKAGITFL